VIWLDLAGLVLVASRTLDLDEEAVLGLADLDAAESVLTLARDGRGGPAQQAAMLLGGLVRRRVFGPRSAEVAVMATLQLLALNGQQVGDLGSPAALRELVAGIAAGQLGTDELAAWLAERLQPAAAPRRAGRLLSRRVKDSMNPKDPRHADDRMEGGIFERFTNRARNVVKLAQEEARRLDHDHIGTEHVLLGLLGEPEGIGAKALVALGVSLEAVHADVERTIGRGEGAPTGHIPFTPRAKKVLELSLREALKLHHNYIGTEHIVLGLVREGEGVAANILVESGADLPEVRQEVLRLLSTGVADRAGAEPPKERLIADIEALYEEIVRLAKEVDRLTELLREHGIEPEEGTSRSA
jgi:Clp amino terminal domain, pathogenicity island component